MKNIFNYKLYLKNKEDPIAITAEEAGVIITAFNNKSTFNLFGNNYTYFEYRKSERMHISQELKLLVAKGLVDSRKFEGACSHDEWNSLIEPFKHKLNAMNFVMKS